jgi:hypothetical protein
VAREEGVGDVRRAAAPFLFRGATAWLLLVTPATLLLWSASMGKWSDALIDSGSEWIYADALSRGELLYRDVVYWFGPFTPYFHALFFALFGSSFRSLAIAGIAGSLGVLAALYLALRRVTGRREAALWTALAIPALVFMPNAGGAIIGMGYRLWHPATFALLAVSISVRSGSRSVSIPLAAGVLAALAGLSRVEWGLAAAAAAALAVALRQRTPRSVWRDVALVATGFAVVLGAGLGSFLLAAGRDALFHDAHVLLIGLPEETRTFLVRFSGILDWRRGLLELLYSVGVWGAAFLMLELFALRDREPRRFRRRLVLICALLPILALIAFLGGAADVVPFSAAPAVSLAALAVAVRRGRGPRSAALAAFGFLGLVLSYRRPFHISDSAYVAPPLLFAFASAAGLLRVAALRLGSPSRAALRSSLNLTLAFAVLLAFVGRYAAYRSDRRPTIPGTDGMLRASPELSRDIAELASTIRRQTREPESLVVFPEGQVLNFLSGWANPIRHKLFIPGYLTEENEARVLSELRRARPGAIVIWRRAAFEYDRGYFGDDYGQSIARWIEANYAMRPFFAEGGARRVNPTFRYGFRRGRSP